MHPTPVPFAKYDASGAYHWIECDRRSSMYHPPLRALYEAVAKRVTGVRRVLDVGCGDGYLMGQVSARWFRLYSTKIGWRVIRLVCRLLNVNPFRREGAEPDRYDQVLAVCR